MAFPQNEWRRYPHIFLPLFIFLVTLASSSRANPGIDIDITLQSKAPDQLLIEMRLSSFGNRELEWRGIPLYVANPIAEANGQIVQMLPTDTCVEPTVRYLLKPDYFPGKIAQEFPIPITCLGPSKSWLLGTHVFLTPELSDNLLADLRVPLSIDLRFHLAKGVALVGVPREIHLENLHELLSLQFGFGFYETLLADDSPWPGKIFLDEPANINHSERKVLVRRLEEATRVDASGFFSQYVDVKSPPTKDEFKKAMTKARKLGIFSVQAEKAGLARS